MFFRSRASLAASKNPVGRDVPNKRPVQCPIRRPFPHEGRRLWPDALPAFGHIYFGRPYIFASHGQSRQNLASSSELSSGRRSRCPSEVRFAQNLCAACKTVSQVDLSTHAGFCYIRRTGSRISSSRTPRRKDRKARPCAVFRASRRKVDTPFRTINTFWRKASKKGRIPYGRTHLPHRAGAARVSPA